MKKKLAILFNVVSPYQVPIYNSLANDFDVYLIVSKRGSHRGSWEGIEKDLNQVHHRRVFTIAFRINIYRKGKEFDTKKIFFPIGMVWHLIKIRPDIIISNEMGFRTLLAWIYHVLMRVPLFIWWEGPAYLQNDIGKFKNLWRRFLSKRQIHWIAVGENSEEYLIKTGVPNKKIGRITFSIDQHSFQNNYTAKWDIVPKPVLLYVGQLIPRKGVDKFLHAASRVQKRISFSILIVGDGKELNTLKKFSESLDLKNVHFYDSQPSSTMPSVYKSANILVLPSLEDVWGLVINEALWSGIPAIGSIYAGAALEILPPENRFDPLNESQFDEALIGAIEGRISLPGEIKLKTYEEVANEIKDFLNRFDKR